MHLRVLFTPVSLLATCLPLTGALGCAGRSIGEGTDTGTKTDTDTGGLDGGATTDTATQGAMVRCDFDYATEFAEASSAESVPAAIAANRRSAFLREPAAPYTYVDSQRAGAENTELVLPGYEDNMPIFDRGGAWTEATRCYEFEDSARMLTEAEAYDLYCEIAAQSTGTPLITDADVRTVIGIRGAYPGIFYWNGNGPDLFNDTLVLVWVDGDGTKYVREFPGHTDVGAYDFGFEASSFLPANRAYRYVNGVHGDPPYSAFRIDERDYTVMNDTNANGHWDDDRNGRLPPEGDDYLRTGFGHNIHVGSVDGPLGAARVGNWSAGCQLIAGMGNWKAFIRAAWTFEGAALQYFLIDARDIAPRFEYSL